MAGVPTGIVTFLFTDIEGSTKFARGDIVFFCERGANLR